MECVKIKLTIGYQLFYLDFIKKEIRQNFRPKKTPKKIMVEQNDADLDDTEYLDVTADGEMRWINIFKLNITKKNYKKGEKI